MKRIQQSLVLLTLVAMLGSGCSIFKSNCDCPKFSKAQDNPPGVAVGSISNGVDTPYTVSKSSE